MYFCKDVHKHSSHSVRTMQMRKPKELQQNDVLRKKTFTWRNDEMQKHQLSAI